MANPFIKDTLHTHDNEGNTIDVFPATTDDQVQNLSTYVKDITCDDHTLTITRGNGEPDPIKVEISNEIISDEEINTLWDITDSGEKSY